ncbi:AraC family transcriptional regulator [Paenibacillus whitsoniae]|uniref:AraC family transcriptional regulator n=1 Tax=Paenibacillus whitsoniae TaxID=2496558 RepID=UPI0013DFFFBB|nr:AraC family transcriptional regulator [Paenibacillus whitsoniae]
MRKAELWMEKGEHFFTNGFSIFVNRVQERFELPEHVHDFYEICYVVEGSGFHYVEEETIRVRKGDLFFLPIGVSHIFRPASADPKKRLLISNCIFDEQLFQFLTSILPGQFGMYRFREQLLQRDCWLQIQERSGEFGTLFNSLFEEFQQKRTGYETMLCGLLLQLFIQMERALEGAEAPVYNRMETILRVMRERLGDKITLAQLAKEVGLGTRQLQRDIAEHMGCSFSELLLSERINRSCRLLEDTANSRRSIADIAAAIGLQDPKRFYRVFKEKTGMTPAQYRAERGTI